MTATIVLPRRAKPTKALSTDQTRPDVCAGHLTREGSTWSLIATNTYLAVRLPVTVTGKVEETPLPAEAIKAAEGKDVSLSLNGNDTIEACGGKAPQNVLYRRPKLDKDPPDVGRLIADRRAELEKSKTKFVVGLNATFLARVATALGTSGAVKLTFDTKSAHRPILVEGVNGEAPDADGLLMPIVVHS